jgi:hypothetical protein
VEAINMMQIGHFLLPQNLKEGEVSAFAIIAKAKNFGKLNCPVRN